MAWHMGMAWHGTCVNLADYRTAKATLACFTRTVLFVFLWFGWRASGESKIFYVESHIQDFVCLVEDVSLWRSACNKSVSGDGEGGEKQKDGMGRGGGHTGPGLRSIGQ